MLCGHVFINNPPLSRGMLFKTTYSYLPILFYTIFSWIFDNSLALLVSEWNGFSCTFEKEVLLWTVRIGQDNSLFLWYEASFLCCDSEIFTHTASWSELHSTFSELPYPTSSTPFLSGFLPCLMCILVLVCPAWNALLGESFSWIFLKTWKGLCYSCPPWSPQSFWTQPHTRTYEVSPTFND